MYLQCLNLETGYLYYENTKSKINYVKVFFKTHIRINDNNDKYTKLNSKYNLR